MGATSNRELARQLGVSETAVRRAEKAGRIRREADGAWDLARVRAAWAGNTDPAQQRTAPGAGDRSRRAAQRAVKPVACDSFSDLHSPLGQKCCGENDCRQLDSATMPSPANSSSTPAPPRLTA
jgi:hypothetical protein